MDKLPIHAPQAHPRDRILRPSAVTCRDVDGPLARLEAAGDMCANACFNLAQNKALDARDRECLDDCRRAWDDAKRAVVAQRASDAPPPQPPAFKRHP